jgi:hypothetical protein
MVSGATIAEKVNYGLGISGSKAGFPMQWYRPSGSGPVIASGNLQGTVNAIVSPATNFLAAAGQWGKGDRFGAFDPTNFLAGDYIVGGDTLFVAEIVPSAAAVRLVLCNEVLTWSTTSDPPPGPGFRPGVRVATPVVTGWPAWLQPADKKSPSEMHLPGAVEMPNVAVFLPASIPGQILRGDQLQTADPLPITYTVESAIYSPNGWQITAIRGGA